MKEWEKIVKKNINKFYVLSGAVAVAPFILILYSLGDDLTGSDAKKYRRIGVVSLLIGVPTTLLTLPFGALLALATTLYGAITLPIALIRDKNSDLIQLKDFQKQHLQSNVSADRSSTKTIIEALMAKISSMPLKLIEDPFIKYDYEEALKFPLIYGLMQANKSRNQAYWENFSLKDKKKFLKEVYLSRFAADVFFLLGAGFVELSLLSQNVKLIAKLNVAPITGLLLRRINLDDESVDHLRLINNPRVMHLLLKCSTSDCISLFKQIIKCGGYTAPYFQSSALFALVETGELTLDMAYHLSDSQQDLLKDLRVRYLLRKGISYDEVFKLSSKGLKQLNDIRIRRMVETRELSITDVNSLTNRNISELLADKFSFLFAEKALQKSEVNANSVKAISEQLYANEAAIYYNNSYETLAQFFDSASFANFKEQFNKIIHHLNEWCSQFNIKPMCYQSSAAEILALFQDKLWTGFYSDHQTIIFSQVKFEMENIVLALNNAEIVHDIKANCIINLLEGIVVCSGGVVFAVNEAYRSLYLHNECFAFLAEARYFLAKEIALKVIGPYIDRQLIRKGDEIHFAMALLTLVQVKLQIDVPTDPLICNALPDNLVNQFYKLLLEKFQPQNLAQALVQLFLPKMNQILNTNQKEEISVVAAKLNQLLSSLGEHEQELEETLITIEDKEVWLKYIIIDLLIREGFFDLDILTIKSSPERKSTLDVLTVCYGEMLYSKIRNSITDEKDNVLERYAIAFNLIFDDDLLLHYGKKSWKINLDVNLEISINLMHIYQPLSTPLFRYDFTGSKLKLLKTLFLRLYWETQTTEHPFDSSNKSDIFKWLACEKTIPDFESLCLQYKILTNPTTQENVAQSEQRFTC